MFEFGIAVDVSLARPPRADTTIFFKVMADSDVDAQLIACQMASCHPQVVMPVTSRIISCVV